MMSEDKDIFKKLHSGELYIPAQPEILAVQRANMDKMHIFNSLLYTEAEKRAQLCKEMFLEFGEGSFIEGPFYANFGGAHVKIGKDVYANSNLTLVDDTYITIKDNTMIAPNVTLATAAHPLNPKLRREGYQYNLPVEIGENVWLGTGVIVLPGVKIGDNAVIGAGSVVTRDIPPNVLAMGTPCRVVKHISDQAD